MLAPRLAQTALIAPHTFLFHVPVLTSFASNDYFWLINRRVVRKLAAVVERPVVEVNWVVLLVASIIVLDDVDVDHAGLDIRPTLLLLQLVHDLKALGVALQLLELRLLPRAATFFVKVIWGGVFLLNLLTLRRRDVVLRGVLVTTTA